MAQAVQAMMLSFRVYTGFFKVRFYLVAEMIIHRIGNIRPAETDKYVPVAGIRSYILEVIQQGIEDFINDRQNNLLLCFILDDTQSSSLPVYVVQTKGFDIARPETIYTCQQHH